MRKLQDFSEVEYDKKHNSLLGTDKYQDISYDLKRRDVISHNFQSSFHSEGTYNAKMVHYNFKLGIFYIILGLISFSIMDFGGKLIYTKSPYVTGWVILLMRGIMTPLYLYMQASYEKINLFEFKGYKTRVMVAAGFGNIVYTGCLLSYQYVSVTKATLIIYANPIVVIIVAYFLLNERMTSLDIICLFAVLIGTFITGMHSGDSSLDLNPPLGYLFATISGFSFGIMLVLQRDINMKLSAYVLPFYMSLSFIVPCSIMIFGTDTTQFSSYTLYDIGMILIVNSAGIGGVVLTSMAYKYADASILGPFWNLEIIFLYICEATILGYDFILTDFIGGAMIIGGLLSMVVYNKN